MLIGVQGNAVVCPMIAASLSRFIRPSRALLISCHIPMILITSLRYSQLVYSLIQTGVSMLRLTSRAIGVIKDNMQPIAHAKSARHPDTIAEADEPDWVTDFDDVSIASEDVCDEAPRSIILNLLRRFVRT